MKPGNFNGIEDKIAAWEKKYPLAEFTNPEIIRKIKAILNKEFLSRLMGDYLAAKVLHEREKQLEAYKKLEEIINSAKKSKDYTTALKETRKWKENLGESGLSIYSFDRYYRPKVCTLLLIPSKELKNQEEATQSLKKLKDKSHSMDSKSYAQEISNWQDKYCLEKFPDKLQSELNAITADVLKSISEKKNEETALEQLQSAISSNNGVNPVDAIALILSQYDYTQFSDAGKQKVATITQKAVSIGENFAEPEFHFDDENANILSKNSTSSVQFRAIGDLKDIFSRNSHDLEGLLNWIYLNRKINFTQFARDEIIKQFVSAGYKIPAQTSYCIPEINASLTYQNFSKIDEIRKDVILNYLGIIAQGNSLSRAGKDNLSKIHTTSEQESIVSKNEDSDTFMVLPVYENTPQGNFSIEDKLYNEAGAVSENKEDELVHSIVIEDLLEDPLETYVFVSSKVTTSLEEKPIVPNIENSFQEIVENSNEEEILDAKTIFSSTVTDTASINEVTRNEDTLSSKTTTKEIQKEEISAPPTIQVQKEKTTTCTFTLENHNNNEEEVSTYSSNSEEQENFSSYSLTLEDQKNLEQANNESAYIIVATPILEMALANTFTKSQASREYQKEYIPEKNNGF